MHGEAEEVRARENERAMVHMVHRWRYIADEDILVHRHRDAPIPRRTFASALGCHAQESRAQSSKTWWQHHGQHCLMAMACVVQDCRHRRRVVPRDATVTK